MIETAVSKALEKGKDYLIEKSYTFSPGNVLRKKAKRKSSFKNKIPICNWTMPAQPEGYIRAGKYDLL
jgi:hypothetical protein